MAKQIKFNFRFYAGRLTSGGMSIIELIVAIGIFSVAVMSTVSMFQMAIQGQMQAMAAVNIQESMRYALETMSKEIRNVGGQIQAAGETTQDCTDFSTPASQRPLDNKNLYSALNWQGGTQRVVNSNLGHSAIGEILVFRNKYGKCVRYFLQDNRITISREGFSVAYITPAKVKINSLKFYVKDDDTYDFTVQPEVTIMINAEISAGKYKQNSTMQTSVTARNYTKVDNP
jgi:Tfp pilus assembly protein PilW